MASVTGSGRSGRVQVVAPHLVSMLVLVVAVFAAFSGATLTSPLRQSILTFDQGESLRLLALYAVCVPAGGAFVSVIVRRRFPQTGKRVCALWGPLGAWAVILVLAIVLGMILLFLTVPQEHQTHVQAVAAAQDLWLPLVSFATYLAGIAWGVLDMRRSAARGRSLLVLGAAVSAPGAVAIVLIAVAL